MLFSWLGRRDLSTNRGRPFLRGLYGRSPFVCFAIRETDTLIFAGH
jgi:hypothetical protein